MIPLNKMESIESIYELLDKIPITEENQYKIERIKREIENKNYISALNLINDFDVFEFEKEQNENKENKKNNNDNKYEEKEEIEEIEEIEEYKEMKKRKDIYPEKLSDLDLEVEYIGILLNNPKLIVKYYFLFKECYFESDIVLNLYKGVLFTEGAEYTPEIAKDGFNFAKEMPNSYELKYRLKKENLNKEYKIENVYNKLKKLFKLRKKYLEVPIASIQEKIVEIIEYDLYDKMSVEEVESAINQVETTQKFKKSILNINLTDFLEKGENNLTNGLDFQFPILSSVFKGIRKGETMAFAMPSNAGKSRFTVNLAAFTSLIHKKKVLIISNEMSEEKMRLTLITTILNNPQIQKMHGQNISKTEGELLEFKFRPDKGLNVETDENGFIIQKEDETRKQFVKRLEKISKEFNQVIKVTDWINKQIKNSIYFINITDHTNDELKKVIMNYYYKEKIQYIFYDTLKTDTANIGNAEEIKRTATILSNLAQNFELFIFSTIQLSENKTEPINLDVNDLAVSKTVKEVLDTLCLVKQISRDKYEEYQYSEKEIDKKFFNLQKFEDPDERYYAFIVDKNRAGAKPKLLFNLNLAYNRWIELGYLSLK